MAVVNQTLALSTLVVRDYDEAIAFFVGTLGFRLIEDTDQPEQAKRWVVVQPAGAGNAQLLLARASTPEQTARIGSQTGGRVAFFLYTDDFERDHARYSAAGVRFVRPRTEQPYGTVAVFADLYGNLWDLVQLRQPPPAAVHSVVYAKHKARVAAFYRAVLALAVAEDEPGFTLLAGRGIELSVVQAPEAIAREIILADPPTVREDTPLKTSFLVDDLEALRPLVLAHGGTLKPPEAAWAWRGALHLDGTDPEGNVVQFRCAAPRP